MNLSGHVARTSGQSIRRKGEKWRLRPGAWVVVGALVLAQLGVLVALDSLGEPAWQDVSPAAAGP